MLRPDFFDLVGYAVERRVGVKFSTNGTRLTPARARQLAALDYVDVQISLDGAIAATNDAVRGEGSYAAARQAMDNLAAAGFGPFKISVVVTRQNVDELDALAALADELRRPAAPDPAAPVGPRRRLLGRPAPDGGAAAPALPLAARPTRRADRRLLLPPLGAGRAARRAQPVRGRSGRLPDRPGGRRLRLPLRDRPPVPGRQRARPGRLRHGVARVRPLQLPAPAARARAPARRAAPSTPAGAAAWRPSSSPASRSTAPTPSACTATARRPWRRWTSGLARPRALEGGARRDAAAGADARALPLAGPYLTRMELAGATWAQVEATGGRSVLALPLGSLEQHGPHLPLDTDTRIARAVAAGLARRRPGVAVAPALSFGASGEHAGFPGTLVVGHGVLADLLTELVRSARSDFAGVVVVNAHGGNREALDLLRARSATEGDDVLVWSPAVQRRRRPRRPQRDLAPAGHRPGRGAPRAGRGRMHRAAGVVAAPPARRGSAAGIVQRRAGRPRRSECRRRAHAAPRPGDGPGRRRVVALARSVSPVAVVTGAARGIGAATVDALVGRRLAGGGGRPRRGRPGGQLPPGLEVGPRGAGRAPRRRRAHGRGRRAPPRRHAGGGRRGRPPLRRPAGGGRRRRCHQRWAAAVGDGRRAVGRAVRRQRQRRAPPGLRRRAGALARPRAAARARGGGGLGRRPARPAPAQCLQRVEGAR